MQYIVLDLEWNQPLSYNSSAYKSVGGKLLFEMIQIGAVKLDASMKVVDTFNQLICPTHYVKLHPRIKRITQISQEDVSSAPPFPEAIDLFAAWCGEDYKLLTWGCDDVSVLAQNISFFKVETKLSEVYDIQQLYGTMVGNGKERAGLKSAMEHYEIQPDDEMPFHNALNDAYYTALVFSNFPEPEKVLECPLTPRKLKHIERKHEHQAILRVRSAAEGLRSAAAGKPPCPTCGKHMDIPEGYVEQAEDKFMALADCPQHGLVFVKLAFGKNDEGKRVMIRTASISDEQSSAYVTTKHLQWRNKVASQILPEE